MTLTSTAMSAALPAPDETQTLLSVLDILAHNKRALSGWLRGFGDVDRAFDLARQSYWHPNGFAKLTLHIGANHKVRLHVWPAGSHRLGDVNPHGHRWNFASTVICGSGLEEIYYVEACAGIKYERYEYVGGNSPDAMVPDRQVPLTPRGSRERYVGDRYKLDTSVVHTARPLGSALVATLVIQGPPRVASAPVYGIPGVNVGKPGRAISVCEVRGLICGVLEAID